ncbi:MAG: CshA/CshB family fibrillar adhesin-related protein, partial [Niameybacter sp.]
MAFAYAAAGSGPSAGGIGWANFGNLNLQPGGSPQMFTGTLNDGTKVTFDVSVPASSAMTFNSRTSPSTSVFGYYAYVGTGAAQILLQNDRIGSLNPGIITINNIVVTDSLGNPVTNYTVVVADTEESNIGESWNFQTDGGVWNQFYLIQGSGTPSISGLGSPSVTITGVDQLFSSSYLLTTESAKNLTLTAISAGGLEAVAIGFAVTKVSLFKNIGDRLDSNDQFVLSIQGNP